MPEIDPVILQLRADMAKYQADIKGVTVMVQDKLAVQERAVQRLEKQFKASTGQIGGTMRALAGTLATAFTGRELAGLIDGFTRVQNSLRVAGLEGDALASVQGRLLELSSRYGVGLEELARLYGNSSQAASDLGASQNQLVALTEASAQALKITGTSAVQAQGAILGLTQALASGTVRAEEFNQINEGGLRPLLQVVANTERFGGSIAKLRTAVVDGKVTSQEFFAAIMNGSAQLDGQASKATLTLSGSFEALTSNLMVYMGEADKSAGVSAALAEAIAKLADNLDILVPALATIAAAIGIRYVAGAMAATTATTALRTALVSLQTVGIAAVVAGIGYLVTKNIELARQSENLAVQVKASADSLAQAEKRARDAGVQVDKLGTEAKAATGDVLGIGNAIKFASEQAASFAKNARLAAAASATLRAVEAEKRIAAIDALGKPNNTLSQINKALGGDNSQVNDAYKRLQEERGALRIIAENARREAKVIAATPESAFADKPASVGPPATDSGRSKRSTGPSAADIEARYQQQLESETQRTIAARADLATSIEERAEMERRSLEQEVKQRSRDIDTDLRKTLEQANTQAEKDIAAAKAKELRAQVEATAQAERQIIDRNEQEALAREAQEVAEASNRNAQDLLRADGELASSRKEYLDIQMRLLDLAYEQERAELEAAIASATATQAQKDIAEARLRILDQLKARDQKRIERDNASPMDRYKREITDTANNIDDTFEQIQVDGLRALNDGLTDAIMNSKSLGDVFSNVARSIIADLIRIAIRQTIVNSLMQGIGSLFGGGSGSFAPSSAPLVGTSFAASGTNFAHAGVYRVGESGPETVMLPQGAKVIPADLTRQIAGKPSQSVVVVQVRAGELFEASVQQISSNVAAPMAVQAGMASSEMTERRMGRRARNRLS